MATQVTIEGQVLLPDGNGPKSGTITYELSGNAKDSSGNKIVGRGVITVPEGGVLDGQGVTILATADLTPATRTYSVVYRLLDANGVVHGNREVWTVSASTPQNIGDLVA